MKNKKALDTIILIPDISGFTQFAEETAIEHGAHIIEELLEIILACNTNNLDVAEIEGDAVFFYTYQTHLWKNIWHQLTKTFEKFHHHLKRYEVQRICQCGACLAANNLSLKFILHKGETILMHSLKKAKPYGNAVIKSHKLLKNNVPSREYVLMTDEFYKSFQREIRINTPDLSTYAISAHIHGESNIKVYSLGHLHQNVPPVEHLSVPQLSKKPCRFELTIALPHERLERNLLNPVYKIKWNRMVTEVNTNDPINKVGSEHICLINQNPLKIKTVTHPNISDSWVLGEQIHDFMWAKEVTFYFIIKPLSKNNTLLSFELHWHSKYWLLKLYGSFMKWILCHYYRFVLRKFKKQTSLL